jgi:apolipoprotein N-acyltransferase
LPLLQLLSVTGLWGIAFVMSWLASLVNWAWERGFAWQEVRRAGAFYGSLLALVLLFGGARLAFFPALGVTARVAGVSPSPALLAAANKQVSQSFPIGMGMTGGAQAQREMYRLAYAPVNDELFSLSSAEARAGAKIIVWPEARAGVLQEDEAALIVRASELARSNGIYLEMGVGVLLSHPVQSSYARDESILIDPSGRVLWRYQKTHPAPGDPEPAGDGLVPTVQTPYGRLSNVICFDADFPSTLRQAGQAGADVMLIPSNDWREIDPFHTQMATFRAIENGYSLVRQTSNGLAMTVDYEGNVLASSDFFTSDPQVMVAYVPMQGVRTIYATIGDLFAWLSIAGLVVLIGFAVARKPQAEKAVEVETGEEPLPVS